MPIGRLDHVNLRTTDVEGLAGFYERVLGLKRGTRPDFDFAGVWLYSGDDPVVHIIGVETATAYSGDQQLEHFALRATGLAAFLAHLRAENVAYRCGVLPGEGFGHTQVNIFDHDGNHLHIDFPPDDSADIAEFTGR